jgi:NAD(P)-dependent dehydrogenase (short-subunit alcohol dehydrogenase family)
MTDKKVALVTGASTGFGRVIVETLARRGYVAFAGMRDPEGKNRAARDELAALSGAGLALPVVALDVTDDASVAAAVAEVVEKAGHIDVLVNNAGVFLAGLTECSTIEQARQLFETNYFGPQRLCRAALPHMRRRGSGSLVFVSSVGGRVIVPNSPHYCASKAALEMMAEGYRSDLESLGIDVMLLEAGFFRTRIMHNIWWCDDEARAAQYGALAGVARAAIEAAMAFGGADPQELGDTLVKLLDTPHGQRPLRTLLGAEAPLVAPVNAATDEAVRALRAMWGG